MSYTDGKTLKHMPAVKITKERMRMTRPNTGGMGTYSDADHSLPFLRKEEIQKAQDINQATANALRKNLDTDLKEFIRWIYGHQRRSEIDRIQCSFWRS